MAQRKSRDHHLFCNIGELLTLKGVARRDGRRVGEKDLSLIRRGCMVTEQGVIQWVGRERDLPSTVKKRAKIIDLGGRTVLPAFVECHTHLVFAGDRSEEFELRNQGVTYQEIARRGGGILSTVRKTKRASESLLLDLAQERVNRFTRQGVTTLEVKSGYGLTLRSELKMLRVISKLRGPRVVATFLGAHAIPPGVKSARSYLTSLGDGLSEVRKWADRIDIFVEKGYFGVEEAQPYLERAKKLGFELTIHADQLSLSGGASLAMECGAHSADHLVEVGAEEIARLGKSQTTAVLLPSADFYLKMRYPPARKLIEGGARVALATDFNPGSSPTQDLSLVGVLARLEMKMSQSEVLAAYTYGAASALGLSSQVGTLEVGKRADMVVVDGSWKHLFYQVGYHPVCEVWREGHRLSS